jgi:hypothetical protein
MGAALLLTTVTGQAQDATTGLPVPPPTPAPSGGVAGPPDGRIPPAPVERDPRPLPPITATPTPAPTPTPTPTPAPSSAPTATPRATNPARDPVRQPPRATTDRPVVELPRAAAPVAAPVNDGGPIIADPAAIPSDGREVPPLAPPATDAATDTATLSGGLPEWWPFGAAAALLALFGGLWLLRRRAVTATDDWPADGATSSVPVPAVPATSPVAAKPKIKAKRAGPDPDARVAAPDVSTPPRAPGRRSGADWLAIALEPLSASSTLVNLRLRYRVHLTNRGDEAILGGKLRVQLLSGPQAAEAVIRHWFASDLAVTRHDLPVIAPGETAVLPGEMVVALNQLHPLAIEGRTLIVPVIAAAARFNQPSGMEQCARAFVIGREPAPDSVKLAPFRLDRGPTNFTPLGSRDTGIADSG